MNDLQLLERELIRLSSTSFGRRALITGLPLLLGSCATREKHRTREGDNTGQRTSLSVQDEVRMTEEYMPQMQKDYPRHPNAYAQKYISDLGAEIVAANGLGNNPYKYNFSLVNSDSINAFALPAGTVFVTVPLLKAAKTEAELAGVVGHEIGHIKARHTAERIDQAAKAQKKGILYGALGAVVGGAAGYALGKSLCKKEDKECLQRAAMYGAGAGVAGGLLIQKYGFMANSREDEMEADRIGFRTSVNAGFSKDHVGNFYETLLEMEKQYKSGQNSVLASFADAMSTHPPSKERVIQMREMAGNEAGKGSRISSPTFLKVQQLV
jgi:beta-barrel assembly-enhancing protease